MLECRAMEEGAREETAERRWAVAEVQRLRDAFAEEDFHPTTATVSGVLEFLRIYAGESSEFSRALAVELEVSASNGARAAIEVLESWLSYTDAGLRSALPMELRLRLAASSDLMEQVDELLDGQFHPAAAGMLAGAALEEVLKGLVIANKVPIQGKPGIATYATGLRNTGVITKQEKKLIDEWGAARSEAAHGNNVPEMEARLMVAGINSFLLRFVHQP